MVTETEVKAIIEPLLRQVEQRLSLPEGSVVIFDLELPESDRGVLKVFVTRKKSVTTDGVTHDICSLFAHFILEHPQIEELCPGEVTLEVSSPGINRELTCVEHFVDAVGEHLRIVVQGGIFPTKKEKIPARETVKGTLKAVSADSKSFTFVSDTESSEVLVPFEKLFEGRVDFLF